MFLNEASATLASGELIALGDGGVLTNRGTLSPGGGGERASTLIEGDLVQTGSGRLIVDVDARQTTNDAVAVQGSANLAGKVRVIVGDAGWAGDLQRVTIVEADDGVSSATAVNFTVTPSAVGNYGLVFSNPQKVDLTYAIDFSTPALEAGLNDNQEAVAGGLDGLHQRGSDP